MLAEHIKRVVQLVRKQLQNITAHVYLRNITLH
jgi:hypothetical protein